MKEQVTILNVKTLRAKLGVGIKDAVDALRASDNDMEKAESYLRENNRIPVNERMDGWQEIFTYNHNGRIASVVVLQCATDFVARTEEFKKLGKDLCIHVAGYEYDVNNPLCLDDQPFIRDPSKTVKQVMEDVMQRTSEHIRCVEFKRYCAMQN